MAREYLDWTDFTDDREALMLFNRAMRSTAPFDFYGKKKVFKAVALTKSYNLSAPESIGLGGFGATGGVVSSFCFKGRVIDENSPHSFLPDPCALPSATSTRQALDIIQQHTTFIAHNAVQTGNGLETKVLPGDIVEVELVQNTFSYNLQYGEFIQIIEKGSKIISPTGACSVIAEMFGKMPPGPGSYSGPDPSQKNINADGTVGLNDTIRNAIWNVLAREGKSKNYTDLIALDGGTVGICHFAAGGINSLYDKMSEEVTQSLFGKSRAELKAIDCVGSTPRGKNDNGTGCHSRSWWKSGMEKFVANSDYNSIQDAACRGSRGKSTKSAISQGWKTDREMAIAIGVSNSLGNGGFRAMAAKNGWNAEATLAGYVAAGGEHTGHRQRRADAINKHFPIDNQYLIDASA